ncbi:mCG146084, partial [Mus musculus]
NNSVECGNSSHSKQTQKGLWRKNGSGTCLELHESPQLHHLHFQAKPNAAAWQPYCLYFPYNSTQYISYTMLLP